MTTLNSNPAISVWSLAFAQLCIRYGLTLLTTDKDFVRAAAHCPLRTWKQRTWNGEFPLSPRPNFIFILADDLGSADLAAAQRWTCRRLRAAAIATWNPCEELHRDRDFGRFSELTVANPLVA